MRFFSEREQGVRMSPPPLRTEPHGAAPGSSPPSALCPQELCCGEVLSRRFSLRGKNPSSKQSATHRRSLPDELDGELLAVKQGGLIRWELRIHKKNLLFQTFPVKLLECLLFHPNNGKIAADDG